MKHSTGKPTRDQERRFEQIRERGCIACRMRDIGQVWPEIHHLLNTGKAGNGRRIGHDATVGLCKWHHRGLAHVNNGRRFTCEECLEWLGPSLAAHPRAFHEEFGDDEKLLAYQDRLLGITTQ